MNKLEGTITESLNKFIGHQNNNDTLKNIQTTLQEALSGQTSIGINNIQTITSTNGCSIQSVMPTSPYTWSQGTITNGYNNTQQRKTYNILGHEIELNVIYDTGVINSIALINIHGYKFYYELKKNHIKFPNDLDTALQTIMQIEKIDDKISEICK
jgi:hypothetical protein